MLDSVMVFIAKYSPYLIASVVFVNFILGDERKKSLSITAAISGGFALLLNLVIALFYYSPRPFLLYNVTQLLPHSADSSFPSDHTAFAFGVAVTILAKNKILGSALVVFSFLTGISRVYCGLHYPIDILGGVVTGITSATLTLRISGAIRG